MTTSLNSIPLISRVNIKMSPVGPEADAASAQFAKVFSTVWARLPSPAKVSLTIAWRATPATIFLTKRWTGQVGRLAQCAGQGTILHFYSPALARMPDDVLAVCIAHELARAFLFTTGDPHHCGGLDDRLFDKTLQYRLAEALARGLCDAWGFNPRLLGRWCVENEAWFEANASGFST